MKFTKGGASQEFGHELTDPLSRHHKFWQMFSDVFQNTKASGVES